MVTKFKGVQEDYSLKLATGHHFCRGINGNDEITHSECVCVALVIQHAKRMRRSVFSSVASLAPVYFSTLSHKRHDFRERVIGLKTHVLIFSATFI